MTNFLVTSQPASQPFMTKSENIRTSLCQPDNENKTKSKHTF
jgi:hypothetical protein